MAQAKPLRIMTYLSPDVPISLFELVRDYLEEKTGMKSYLITESRWDGPPEDRTDPLTGDMADIVFLSSSAFLEQKEKNKFLELCQAAPVYIHPKASDVPVCFSEIVVLKSKVEQNIYRDFDALRGSRWAYTHKKSVTGSTAMLAELKKHGYDANFFGTSFESGSHLNSIQMLLSRQVDVASVDSVVMSAFRIDNPKQAEELHTLKSLGPFPIYSIVFNKRLPAELKDQITKALQNMTQDSCHKWASHFLMMGVKSFTGITEESFSMEKDIKESVKSMSIVPAYY